MGLVQSCIRGTSRGTATVTDNADDERARGPRAEGQARTLAQPDPLQPRSRTSGSSGRGREGTDRSPRNASPVDASRSRSRSASPPRSIELDELASTRATGDDGFPAEPEDDESIASHESEATALTLQDIAHAKPAGELIPGLPDEIGSGIILQAERPFTNGEATPRSAARFGQLMTVSRSWLREIIRQSNHVPDVRRTMFKDRQDWFREKIEALLDDPHLDPHLRPEALRQSLARVLDRTPHVGLEVFAPPNGMHLDARLANQRIALGLLSQRSGISTLKFDASQFAAAPVEELIAFIAAVLPNNPTLEDLDLTLTDAGLTAANVAALLMPMAGRSVSQLCLDRNQLGPDGARAMANLLPAIELGELRLYGCSLGNDGAVALASALPKSIRRLQLGANAITRTGATAIVSSVVTSTLEFLGLGQNGLDGDYKAWLKAHPPSNKQGRIIEIQI